MGEVTPDPVARWNHRWVTTLVRAGVLLAAYGVLLGVLVGNGLTLWAGLGYSLYLGLVILLPGALLWELVQRGFRDGEEPRAPSWFENVVAGASLGYLVEIVSYAVARAVDQPRLHLLGPALVVGAALVLRRGRDQVTVTPSRDGLWSTAALAAVVAWTAVWLGMQVLRWNPLAPGVITDPDGPFHLALIGELRHHFPAVYPYVADEPLTYQYAYHLHAAASTWTTGRSATEVLLRLDPLVFTTLAVLGAAVVTRRLTGRRWPGVVAAGILTLVGTFDLSGLKAGQSIVEDRFLTVLLVHSPTQALAFVLACPLLLISLDLIDPRVRASRWAWVVLGVLCVLMMGAKVTFVPMLLAGAVGTAALALVVSRAASRGAGLRPTWLRGSGVAVLGLLSAGLVGLALYRGETRQLTWEPLALGRYYAGQLQLTQDNGWLAAYVAATMLVAVMLPAAGLVVLLGRSHRSDPRVWFLLLVGLSGMGAAHLLGHPGVSQRYFQISAALPLSVAGAWGLAQAVGSDPARRRLLRLSALAGLAGLGVYAARTFTESRAVVSERAGELIPEEVGLSTVTNLPLMLVLGATVLAFGALQQSSLRAALRAPEWVVVLTGCGLAFGLAFSLGRADPVQGGATRQVPADGVRAVEWLRDNAPTDALVLTNAHCGPVEQEDSEECDNRHFWMAALSERRFLIEGWAYTGSDHPWVDMAYPGPAADLVANDRVFRDPTDPASRRFLAEREAGYLLVDRLSEHDWAALRGAGDLQLELESERFAVFRVFSP